VRTVLIERKELRDRRHVGDDPLDHAVSLDADRPSW
jgi:hypothetical protein